MAQLPFVALPEVGPEDAEFISFLDTPQAKVNVVNAPGIRTQLDGVWDTIRRVKTRRSGLEEEWLAIQRMTVLEHDEGQRYKGRSNAYLPVYARARKTLTSQLSKSLFPSDDYMDVVDRENGENEQAKAVKAVVQYEFETSAKIRAVIKPFLGQFVDFGFGVIKRWYRTDKVVKMKRSKVSRGGMPPSEVTYDEGFTLSNRSAFNVVVYPEWAESKRDLQMEAERLDIPMSYVQLMINAKRWENGIEALSTGSSTDNFDWHNQETLSDVAKIPGVTDFRNDVNNVVSSVIGVEVWCRLVLPAAQYAPEEDKTQPIPARVMFINGVPVQCRRNNFNDQESPLEYARDNIIAGSFYGNGAGRLVRFLQYLANDFANQTNDVGIYGLNPITLVNTNYFSGAMTNLRPGVTYRTRDVDKAMKFVKPDVEIVQYGQTLLNQIVTMAQDGSGAPPVLQGSKAASTATGSQLLQQNAQSPLQDTVEDIEAQVMVPLMHAAWSLAVQYRSKPLLRKMLGEPSTDPTTGAPVPPQMEPVSILPADINIDPEMRFLASSQAVNRQQRQQGLLAFSQLATSLGQNLQMQGKMLNPEPILQKAWTDGLGNRNFDKLIVPIPQAPQQAQPPGQVPPSGGPETMPVPSTVGQGNVIPEGEVNPQDGESNAQDITGPMGSMGQDPGGMY